MAIVSAELRYAPKSTAWFTTNAAMVLAVGEPAYHETTGLFKLGDGVTALSALSFLPAASAAAYTADESTLTLTGSVFSIKSQTSANFMAKISDATGTGVMVRGTSPTFTTGLTTPLINGTSGTLQIGTTDIVNIGNKATTSQRLVRIGQDTAWIDIGSQVGSTSLGAIYFGQATPSAGNWNLRGNHNSFAINSLYATEMSFQQNGSTIAKNTITGQWEFYGLAQTSGEHTNFSIITTTNTNQTLSTNIPNFKITGSNKQWATGLLGLQEFNTFTSNTISFVGASTVTLAANLSVDYVQGGVNSTITTSAAIYVHTMALTNTTTGIGILVAAPTGATGSNLAAKFTGGSTVTSGAALATTATDGFLYVPSCAGLPTGVPTAQTGTIPIVADSTNNKIYIYSGGAWVALN